ncbi:MAG: hypothetical protein HN929_06390 [Chloroflexi bacterium]|jgi:hypothetical protein|nr:hypothetical protein [Chloroflexota bacterium]MBT7081079.1 hypothetical protein [Chloroflexota bacterium]MBT7289484.1 hypothetical protein [Chloroflexota bacterium]
MSVEDHLTGTEDIIEKISCSRGVKYYVTNKRIIRHMQTRTREEMDDLLCSHVTSISLVSVAKRGLIKIGFILMAIGLLARAVAFFMADDSWVINLQPNYNYVCYGAIGLAFLLVLLGFIIKTAFYQFIAAGITDEIASRWRIDGVKAIDAREFIKAVRESSF